MKRFSRSSFLWTVTALVLVVSLVVPWTVWADVFVWDGDVVTVGNQTTVNLGTVSPGAVITKAVSFQLQCAGKQHVDEGQTVSIAFNLAGSTVPVGGSLSGTNASIGAIPASWPDDTTGGGQTNCPSPVPLLDDNGNSSATITAPTTPGSYTFVVDYSTSLSPAGNGDPQAITGPSPSVIFNLVVSAPSDTTPPDISYTITGTEGDNGWYTSDVFVDWTVSDSESAVTIDEGCVDTTINYDTTGVTLTCVAHSAGGSSSDSVTIKRDATPPTISATLDKSPAASGWFNISTGAPTVSFTCSDATSGIDSCPTSHLFGEGVDQEWSGTAYDKAGNSASAGVSDIDVDLTAPTISASISPARPASGWWNIASGAPTVSFTCSDATSGIDSCPTSHLFGEGVDQEWSGTAYDKAGNSASAKVSDVDVDLTAPTLTWSNGPADGASYYFGFVPAKPICTASDSLSGPNGCTVTGYGTTVGSHTMTATAYDVAGNSKAETRSYEVKAWEMYGFYQPVDMSTTQTVWNTVKGGSTVPLKFEVFAGSLEFTDPSVIVQPLQASKVSCTTGNEDAIEELAAAAGNTVLRYDFTDGQFIYNWKTPKSPGICYKVTVSSMSGSSLTAYFKLK